MLLLTLRNYAGCQIERCTHQSRDEPLGTNSHIYNVGRGYCAFLTHLLPKKRLFLSEIGVYLSRALAVEGFSGVWALAPSFPTNMADITRPRRNTHHAKVTCWRTISSRAFAVRTRNLSSSRHSVCLRRSVVVPALPEFSALTSPGSSRGGFGERFIC